MTVSQRAVACLGLVAVSLIPPANRALDLFCAFIAALLFASIVIDFTGLKQRRTTKPVVKRQTTENTQALAAYRRDHERDEQRERQRAELRQSLDQLQNRRKALRGVSR
jgi:hypothetical protein